MIRSAGRASARPLVLALRRDLLALAVGSGPSEPLRGQAQVGSLTGAVHPSKRNAGVLRLAHGGQKPPVEQKGKSQLDPDLQYGYGP